MARTRNIWWDDNAVRFVLDQHIYNVVGFI
jgi:hypothetical protein